VPQRGHRGGILRKFRSVNDRGPMWHCAQVRGSRAMATELVCRVWHGVQLPMVPSELGLPTA
jgi:hypothetical protein